MAASFRLETRYETNGGHVYQHNRLVDTNLRGDEFENAVCTEICCAKTTASKVTRVVCFTGGGALIGGIAGGPPGAGIGAVAGLCIGVCTIL